MKMFRNESGLKVFSLFTGVIFLNMSFFLAEVCMLEITDRQLMENVCNLVLNGGLEEEREVHTAGDDAPLTVLFSGPRDLLLHHASLFLIAVKMNADVCENYVHANHAQLFSPPPECANAIVLS